MVNSFSCSGVGANTGHGKCALVIGKVAGYFLSLSPFEIPDAKLTDEEIIKFLQEGATKANFTERIFPVHNIVDVADNSSEPTVQTFGYGPQVTTSEGSYIWTFTQGKGGICLLKKLRKFNGPDVYALFYDENGVLFGQKVGSSLKSVPLVDYFAAPWKIATAEAVMGVTAKISVKPKHLNENLGFFKPKEDSVRYEDVEGLQDVVLRSQAHTPGTAIWDIALSTGCDGVDLYSVFGAVLADPDLWVFRNGVTNAPITITSVAENAAGTGYVVTLDTTDTDLPAANGIVLGSLAPPADLAAAGVVGFEGLTLKLTR